MKDHGKPATIPPADDSNLGRSEAIFIAGGVAIIVGGLWLLSQSDGPYHPQIPVTDDFQPQVVAGS